MNVVSTESETIQVAMAQVGFGKSPDILYTLLGSCLGICVWDRHTQFGALAHILLSDSLGDTQTPGKYADTAVAFMKDQLLRSGANPQCLQAKIAGGAKMFGDNLKRDVGKRNCAAVRTYLKKSKIPLISEHTGGTYGRVVRFFLDTGKVDVVIGKERATTTI